MTVGRLENDGDFKISGEINERMPAITDGLVAHFPFDGRGGAFDCIGGHQTSTNIETGVNLIEAMALDWRDPSSWSSSAGMSWDESKQALKIVGYHNSWLKTPIVVDTNKHYQVSIEVMEEEQSSTGLYLGGLCNNAIGERVTPNYDYSYGANAQPATGVWTTYRTTRYGTGTIISQTSQTFNNVVGWTGNRAGVTDLLTKYYYYGGLFNYSSGGVMYIRNLSIKIVDPDTSNTTITNDGVSTEEATTNLIPGGTKNSYPTYGNTHGTYNVNQYNNNQFFSIGTITSVVNNVVTYVPTKSLRTYDAVRPQTTGGGLTANKTYFIKALSPTQFTVHEYNAVQDGSLGFKVHDTINNDIRVPINATNFPTMWHGTPHLPNSGLVKEVIPNGFIKGIKVHDCLRMHTEFRNDGVFDYLAYGVGAPITANVKYTYSFYHRAVTPNAVGRVVTFNLHNGADFGYSTFTLQKEWTKFTLTTSSTVTGNASMYFNAGAGIAWDIAEIQCEQKEFATMYTEDTRSAGSISIPIDIKAPYTFSFQFKPSVSNSYSTSVNWVFNHSPYTNGFIMWKRVTEDYYRIRIGGTDFTFSPTDIQQSNEYIVTLAINTTDTKIYLDGVYKGSIANTVNITGLWFGYGGTANNTYRNISFYNRILSEEEISKLYSNTFSVKKNGDIATSAKLIEGSNCVPSDAYYFPLSLDTKDENKLHSASEEVNLRYENGSTWIGTAFTNLYKQAKTPTDFSVRGRGVFGVQNYGTDVFFKYDYSQNLASTYHGQTIPITIGKQYLAYMDVYISPDANIPTTGTTFVANMEGGCSTSFTYNNTKKGQWQRIIRTPTATTASTNLYLYPTTSTIYATTGCVIYKNVTVTDLPFTPAFANGTRGASSLEFNFYNSIRLDWSKDWTIVYWKKPVGTSNNALTGYNIDSLGSNSNSVGGGYTWWGKASGSNTIDGSTPSTLDPNKYFNTWRMVSLQKTGTTITTKEWSPTEGIYTKKTSTSNTVANYYVNQYGYDFKLGGWDNTNPTNAYYRDLIVAKRHLTDAEVEAIYRNKLKVTNEEIQIANNFKENILL